MALDLPRMSRKVEQPSFNYAPPAPFLDMLNAACIEYSAGRIIDGKDIVTWLFRGDFDVFVWELDG